MPSHNAVRFVLQTREWDWDAFHEQEGFPHYRPRFTADPIPPRYVYFARRQDDHLIKIGLSLDPCFRLATLKAQPIAMLRADYYAAHDLEQLIHRVFAEARRHGEWFEPIPDLVRLLADFATGAVRHVKIPRDHYHGERVADVVIPGRYELRTAN